MGVVLTRTQITNKIKGFAKAFWDMDFNTPIIINGRLTRALGRVVYRRTFKLVPASLELAERLINGSYEESTIDSVIKHELCHWANTLRDLPHKDTDYAFLQELKRVGAHRTGVIDHAGSGYVAVCSKCGKTVKMSNSLQGVMKYTNPKYSTRCCRAKVVYGGYKTVEDKTKEVKPMDQEIAQIQQKYSVTQQIAANKEAAAAVITTKVIVPNGPQGKITNNTMIPVIKELLKKNDINGIKDVKMRYPEVFQSSLKYLTKKEQSLLK